MDKKAYYKEYYRKNRDKRLSGQKEYYQRTKEERQAYQRGYYNENREAICDKLEAKVQVTDEIKLADSQLDEKKIDEKVPKIEKKTVSL